MNRRPRGPARPGPLRRLPGFVVVILDVSVVNVASKALTAEFGDSLAGLEWVINGYTLTFAAFLLTAGALGDRFDPRRIFVAGFALFAVTSLACGAAPTLATLITARVLQGVGAALIVPSSLSLVNTNFPDPAQRTRPSASGRPRAASPWPSGRSSADSSSTPSAGVRSSTSTSPSPPSASC